MHTCLHSFSFNSDYLSLLIMTNLLASPNLTITNNVIIIIISLDVYTFHIADFLLWKSCFITSISTGWTRNAGGSMKILHILHVVLKMLTLKVRKELTTPYPFSHPPLCSARMAHQWNSIQSWSKTICHIFRHCCFLSKYISFLVRPIFGSIFIPETPMASHSCNMNN